MNHPAFLRFGWLFRSKEDRRCTRYHLFFKFRISRKFNLRFPVALVRRAFENHSLHDLVGKRASQVEAVMEMINSGVTGEPVNVEDGDTKVVIKVEDYES